MSRKVLLSSIICMLSISIISAQSYVPIEITSKGDSLILQGNFSSAELLYTSCLGAVQSNNQRVELNNKLLEVYTDLEDFELAAKYITQNDSLFAIGNIPHSLKGSFYYAAAKYCYNIGEVIRSTQYLDSAMVEARAEYGDISLLAAKVLSLRGVIEQDDGDYAKARSYYQESLDMRLKVVGKMHLDYADSMSDLASLESDVGNDEKAISLLLSALKIQETLIPSKNFVCGISQNDLGTMYLALGNYRKSEEYYKKALDSYRYSIGSEHVEYAKTLANLSALYQELGNYDKAEELLLESIRIIQGKLGESHALCAVLMNNLSAIYIDKQQFDKAEETALLVYDLRLKLYTSPHPAISFSLINLGNIYMNIGDNERALEMFVACCDMRRYIYGDSHPLYATALNNLGNAYLMAGVYDKADSCYRQALSIRRKSLGRTHINYIRNLISIGDLMRLKEENASALKIYIEAESLARKNYKGKRFYADILSRIGNVYCKLGKYKKSITYLNASTELYIKNLGEKNISLMRCYHVLGNAYKLNLQYEKALEIYRRAQGLTCDIYGESLKYMSEAQRSKYWDVIEDGSADYNDLCFITNGELENLSGFIYDNLLFSKGLLLNSTNLVNTSILESGDTILINRWKRLQDMKTIIMEMQEGKIYAGQLKEYSEEVETIEKEIVKDSHYYRYGNQLQAVSWESIRSALKADEVAIEFFTAPAGGDTIVYGALLLRSESTVPEFIPLFGEKEITELVRTGSEGLIDYTYSFDGNGERLSTLVWGKFLKHIKPGETIYFAPSGLLYQLSIESLPYSNMYTMADMFSIVRLSSTREIIGQVSKADLSTAVIYGGIEYDVDTDSLVAESSKYAVVDLYSSRSLDFDTINRGSVRYLYGTKLEAESIQNMLINSNICVKLFTASMANEESFKALNGAHQSILHIATHGFFWSDSIAKNKDYFAQRFAMNSESEIYHFQAIDPLNRCGLLFAGANLALQGHASLLPKGVQDGILTAKEISLLDLRDAELIVLSACETGRGEINGEDVFGLQRAFKQAGAQTIIMSLWPVNDAATQLLMTEFYRNWITNHQSKREAFRNAQITTRQKYLEPYYWAGFIMLD